MQRFRARQSSAGSCRRKRRRLAQAFDHDELRLRHPRDLRQEFPEPVAGFPFALLPDSRGCRDETDIRRLHPEREKHAPEQQRQFDGLRTDISVSLVEDDILELTL